MPLHEKLKSIRLNQNISLEEISQRTRISLHILQALEQGDYSVLPMPYVRLFIRSIAKEINFSPDEAIRILEADLQIAPTTPREQVVPQPITPASESHSTAIDSDTNLFSESTWNKSMWLRIGATVVGAAILVLVGRSLFHGQPSPSTPATFALPAPGSVVQDSLRMDVSAAQDTLPLHIQAQPFLAVVKESSQGTRDTVWLADSTAFTSKLSADTSYWFYPASNALVRLGSDTLFHPGSDYTGWGRLLFDGHQLALDFLR